MLINILHYKKRIIKFSNLITAYYKYTWEKNEENALQVCRLRKNGKLNANSKSRLVREKERIRNRDKPDENLWKRIGARL